MITKAEIERLSPDEKLELIQTAWAFFVAAPESLPVTEQEKRELRKRSRAHHSNPESSLSEEQFTAQLNQRLGRQN